jgi:hypothetical protein
VEIVINTMTGTGGYDFGDDADDLSVGADATFDAWIERTAPSLNEPGDVPVSEMWSAIGAAHAASRAAAAGKVPGVRPLRRRHWLLPVTIAATLLLGVALDRLIIARSSAPPTTESVAHVDGGTSRPVLTDSAARSELYRLSAVQTLSQAEALLTAYRTGSGTRSDPAAHQLGGWAREVLGSTRLLIDSPAGTDAQLRPLLNDIELVLVQIVRLSGTPLDSADRALIDRALRDHDLLPRIRTAVPAGAIDATIASDD